MAVSKIDCDAFLTTAEPLRVDIPGFGSVLAFPKQFSTGSVGYNATGKVSALVAGKPVEFQVGLNLTIIGSKGAK